MQPSIFLNPDRDQVLMMAERTNRAGRVYGSATQRQILRYAAHDSDMRRNGEIQKVRSTTIHPVTPLRWRVKNIKNRQ